MHLAVITEHLTHRLKEEMLSAAIVLLPDNQAGIECQFEGATVTITQNALLRKPFPSKATWFKLLCGRSLPASDDSLVMLVWMLENITVQGGGAVVRYTGTCRYVECPFANLMLVWAKRVFGDDEQNAKEREEASALRRWCELFFCGAGRRFADFQALHDQAVESERNYAEGARKRARASTDSKAEADGDDE